MKEELLKPCPFCGAECWLIQDKHDFWGIDGKHEPGCLIMNFDYCDYAESLEAIAAWNTRAPIGEIG